MNPSALRRSISLAILALIAGVPDEAIPATHRVRARQTPYSTMHDASTAFRNLAHKSHPAAKATADTLLFEEAKLTVVGTEGGGGFVFWAGDHEVSTTVLQELPTTILSQRVGPRGEFLWKAPRSLVPGGVPAIYSDPAAVSDGAGGAIVVFEALRFTVDGSALVDLVAQRIGPDGSLLWGDGTGRPVPVASSDAPEGNPAIVRDGAGGVIIVYEVFLSSFGDVDLAAQRLGPDGARLWGEEGKLVAGSLALEENPVALPDGSGGAIVAFDGSFVSGDIVADVDIGAQHIHSNGSLLWGEGGLHSIIVSGSIAPERHPTMVSDGAGGILVALEAEIPPGDEFAGVRDIWAQRIDPDGNRAWGGGQFPIVVAQSVNNERRPHAVPDGSDGAVVVFTGELLIQELLGDFDIWGQRFTRDGEVLWGNAGLHSIFVAASDFPETQPAILGDRTGGAIVAFELVPGPDAGENVDIGVQRLGPGGARLWGDGEVTVVVETSPERAATPALLSDGADGAIVLWHAGENVHARWVDALGRVSAPTAVVESLGDVSIVPAAYTLHPPSPNPFNAETTLRYDLAEAASVRLEVLDLTGQVVARLVDSSRPRGSHRLRWDGRTHLGAQVASGVYLARLQAGGTVRVRKLALIR